MLPRLSVANLVKWAAEFELPQTRLYKIPKHNYMNITPFKICVSVIQNAGMFSGNSTSRIEGNSFSDMCVLI